MKKLLTLLAPVTLLATSCADTKVQLKGAMEITVGDYFTIPLEIDAEVSLNEGSFKIGELTYAYSYNNDTSTFDSYFGYKGSKYPYNLDENTIKIGETKYSLDKNSISDLQDAIINEYASKEE